MVCSDQQNPAWAPGVGAPTYTLGNSEQLVKGDETASWPLLSWDAHPWNPVTIFQKSSGHRERQPMASTKVSPNSQQNHRQVMDRVFSSSPQSARSKGFQDFTAATRGLRQCGAKKVAPPVPSSQSPDHRTGQHKEPCFTPLSCGVICCSHVVTRTLVS